jgi:hypothetical protein
MKKIVVGITAAAALVATSLAPVPAKADPISAWWLLPAFLGGLVVASTVHRPVVAAPRAEYYGPVPAPGPRAMVYGQPRAQYYSQPRAQYYGQPRAQVRARY